jgi:hypothetical protein
VSDFPPPPRVDRHKAPAVLLTFAGLVAAFRVASCCGVPSMLATLGPVNGMAGWLFSVRRVTSSIPASRSRSLPGGWGHPPVAAE